ncbi:MAG TPA: glycine--tRNA ligase subunit beta [Burkholderiales bacterium]|nr:glycine--tRNA ligase subunit beta [Burkholderiales bacterium]
MSEATLLVELLTEELPPKSLRQLSEAFAAEVTSELIKHRLRNRDPRHATFATPRRLAVAMANVRAAGHDSENLVDGPVSSNAKAVEGFARKHGVAVDSLQRRQTPKGEIVVANVKLAGVKLEAVLAEIVEKALKKLPIPKVMRWGAGEAQFVRPVHGLVMLHGTKVVPGEVMGLKSGNKTRGHRFMGKAEIVLSSADQYEKKLEDEGKVLVEFAARRAEIEKLLNEKSKELKAGLGDYGGLLDEVTALVEHPSVYVGEFDKAFLAVPQECLILTMRQNQKYFPLFGADGRLTGKFLIVSNMQVADPRHIVGGNQRVVRPRLEDARFFYDQDRKTRLEERVPQLAKVVYHNKLGSQLERVERVQLLAGKIARQLKADAALAERAAWLAKADLLTGMVGEFPELQGVMGRYYALHDKEPPEVADAIEAHYRPRFAGDRLPEGDVACAVALADKLDAIAGLFSIGQQPSGDKDPFGLRRAALGVVRILVENRLFLSLHELSKAAFAPFEKQAEVELQLFVYERFASYLKELGYSTLQIESVLSKSPANLGVVLLQLDAVKAFQLLPEAESLAAANKRVANILRQAETKGEKFAGVEIAELKEPAEQALFEAIRKTSESAKALYERGDYTGYLKSFAVLKAPVDAFFDKVMVMVEDEKLRRGRLALLRDLRDAMNRVADLSKLAV